MTKSNIPHEVLRINQSKIKRLADTTICPQRYYREDISGIDKRESTEAMLKGQYVEYQLWGTKNREGEIPVLPLLKNGKPSTDQIRLDAVIQTIPGVLDMAGFEIKKTDYFSECMIDDILFHGTMDALAKYKGKPYIVDLKTTQDVTSTFGSFAWGKFTTKHPEFIHMKLDPNGIYIADFDAVAIANGTAMDTIQAHAYMYQMEQFTGQRWGFFYAVFDYKKESKWKLIEVPFSQAGRDSMLERMKGTKHKLKVFKERNYKAIPSVGECVKCKFKECSARMDPEELFVPEQKAINPMEIQRVLPPAEEDFVNPF